MTAPTLEEAFGSDRCQVLCESMTEMSDKAVALCSKYLEKPSIQMKNWINGQDPSKQPTLNRLYALGSYASNHYLMNVEDHTQTIVHLLSCPSGMAHLWSYMSLARVVAESACHFAELEDQKVDPELRLLRGIASHINNITGSKQVVSDISSTNEHPSLANAIDSYLDHIVQLLKEVGISVRRDNRGRINALVKGKITCPLKVNMTDMQNKRLTHVPAAYRLGSAVTHGQHYTLSTEYVGGEIRAEYDIELLVHTVLICLDGLRAMVVACCDSPTSYVKRSSELMKRIISVKVK
ncbi:Uncharacterised protein [Actinomyces naeslundii]|uniref:hypothetical protein n=1 Tax=Actinomyces naeslundii TaxID=1655 RepID=UPI00195BB49A|nr:hypothetical protein [Actinomyces naeslundii]VTX88718.1 Uncharacterised protein [Actinomyces naeslundii]